MKKHTIFGLLLDIKILLTLYSIKLLTKEMIKKLYLGDRLKMRGSKGHIRDRPIGQLELPSTNLQYNFTHFFLEKIIFLNGNPFFKYLVKVSFPILYFFEHCAVGKTSIKFLVL